MTQLPGHVEDMEAVWAGYDKGFKALHFHFSQPRLSITQIWRMVWGVDIFFGPVPLVKVMLLANLLVWGVLVFLR